VRKEERGIDSLSSLADDRCVLRIAMSDTQTATLLVVVCGAVALAMVGFACYAFAKQADSRSAIKQALDASKDALASAQTMVASAPDDSKADAGKAGESAMSGVSDYVRALAELSEKLGKVTPPVAALLLATIPLVLATGIVSVQLLS